MTAPAAPTRRPSRRMLRLTSLLMAPAAVVASALVVAQASYSAYSATTVNPTSNWATGTVALHDDDANAAAFDVSGLAPGSTGTRCIAVTSTGTLGSSVKLYATAQGGTTNLASFIDLTITEGTGGSFGSCSGFVPLAGGGQLYRGSLAGFGTTHTGYANGLGTWTPAGTGEETRTFRLTYTVDRQAPDTTQGGTASGSLTWEAQNS